MSSAFTAFWVRKIRVFWETNLSKFILQIFAALATYRVKTEN
jgi:hypothetical protein